ncbi:UvrD-helicase domain-containing protein [Dissulfurimicrobium hydrothermale]|uniref:UvrD-helicase domain-containing protein n=1 Tax=Dissulfurimicrobium hydrothermale TaxID=1750598 RepID=UPI001EDC33E5|nr:UvrD-helicase domain-containing protein [Dissulfurimicrobium hydrothermale]UKL14621.1 UvrD-helicase domain-containing protein [Dissulfurimicrobium hydrothermale]
MNPLPSDSELKFPHILRVSASAGAGKTHLLAMRFIQLLLSAKIPHNILENIMAITFTREATAEMKRRILLFLKKMALGDAETMDEVLKLTDLTEDEARHRAHALVDEIINAYDKWQIKTIDSFLYKLVKAAPQELGLTEQDELTEFPKPFYEAAMDVLLVSAKENEKAAAFLKKAVLHYLSFQDHKSWWPRDAILKEIMDLYEIECIYGADLDEGRRPENIHALTNLLSDEAAEIMRLADAQGITLNKKAFDALNKIACGDVAGGLSSKYLAKDDPGDICNRCDRRRLTKEFMKAWHKIRDTVRRYAVSRATEESFPYIILLKYWKKELALSKKRSHVLFFSDIARLVKKMHDKFIVSELEFRIGERLFHYLIDEFQDTSLIQWQGLAPLIENSLSQGGSLFCVGDVKQILYRWRGSDRDVFEKKPDSLKGIVESGVLNIALPHNWRSGKVILDFTASLFDPDCLKRWTEDQKLGFNSDFSCFSSAAQKPPPGRNGKKNGGYVRIEFLEEAEDTKTAIEDAAMRLLVLLDDILRRNRPQDIYVLVRDNNQAAIFTHAISRAGIAVLSNRQMDIRQDGIVREILQFLNFLDNPADDHALSAVVTGKIIEDRWKTSVGIDPWRFLESIGPDRDQPLYSKIKKKAPRFWQAVLKILIDISGYLTPYELTTYIVKDLELKTRFTRHWPAILHLLEIFHQKSLDTGLSGLLSWIRHGPDEPFILKGAASVDAVKVMTIHKAKGLQSKVVILPFIGLSVNSSKIRIVEQSDEGLKVLKLPAKLVGLSPGLKRLYENERKMTWLDELNTLYVAVTRAENELYMLVPPKLGGGKNRLKDLLEMVWQPSDGILSLGRPEIHEVFADTRDDNRGTAETGQAMEYWLQKHPGWQHLLKKRDVQAMTDAARRYAARIGDSVHRLLSLLNGPIKTGCEPTAVESYLRIMLKNQDIFAGFPTDEIHMWIAKTARTICLPAARRLFWPGDGAEISVEMEVADENGEISRVDRVIKSDAGILIGEFKTSSGSKRTDLEQIKRYIRLFGDIYPDNNITGLLIYIDLEEVDEVAAATTRRH